MDLSLFSARRLYEALAEHPDRPSFRTVRRWVEDGAQPSVGLQEAIAALVGRPVTSQGTTKDPRPEWAEGLVAEMVDEVRRLLLDPEVESMRQELAAERQPAPPRVVERPPTGHSRRDRLGGSGK